MTYTTALRSAVCLAALTAAGAAQADVTAAQVWEDWKSQLALYGEDNITIGAEETSSGTVTVRDLQVDLRDDDVTIKANMGSIIFNEQSDGSVRVTMDESYPITIIGEDGVVVTLEVSQTDMEMIVSGDAEVMDYAITAKSYGITLQDITDADVKVTADARLTANNLDLAYQTSVGELRNISYDGTVNSIDLLVDFQIPGGNGEYITGAAKYGPMSMQLEMAIPLDADFENPDYLMNDGFSLAGGYTIDSVDFVADMNVEGQQIAMSGEIGQTTLTGQMNSTAVGYDAQTSDLTANVQTSEFPFPIEVKLGSYGIGFQFPTGKSEEPSDFSMSFELVDLAISDAIWDLFDGGNVLPRDPATIQLALVGKAKSLFNMFDPAEQEAMENAEMPYELSAVTLEKLNIEAAGASVKGTGDFTFDNSDMQTFAPMPRPEGEATVQINGLNKLIDNLVAMGLVQEQDIMGPRMMMGMFARSTGDDQMETTVEISPNGQVSVNGNRVR